MSNDERPKHTRRLVTAAEIVELVDGATDVIGPGIWADADGQVHFSVPDLIQFFGWPYDAEHQALVERVIGEVLEEMFPGIPITELVLKKDAH